MQRQVVAASLVVCFVLSLVVAGEKQGKDVNDEIEVSESTKSETIVYSARSTPVRELAAMLAEFFQDSGVRAVAVPISNLLIIRVDAKSRDEVLGLLEKLDQPLRSITVHAQLLRARGKKLDAVDTKSFSGPSDEVHKRIRDLVGAGRLYVANRMELTAVENQKVMLQVGERVAVITGTTTSRTGTPIRSYRDENVGTLISVQARVAEGGGITMNVDFNKSEVVDAEPTSDDKAGFAPSDTATLTQQTTLQIQDGHCVLVGSLSSHSDDETEEVYLVVGAKMVDAGEAAGKPVVFRAFSQREPSPTTRSFSRSFSSSSRGGGFSGVRRLSPSSNPRARYAAYSRVMFEKYDANKDGVLTPEEWKNARFITSDVDADKDGKLSLDELTDWLAKGRASPRSRPPSSGSKE